MINRQVCFLVRCLVHPLDALRPFPCLGLVDIYVPIMLELSHPIFITFLPS
jgi:hypothetical protein